MIQVVLVELKIPENIGFIARLVKNFGIDGLALYKCKVSEESFITAANAKDVLESAIIVENLEDFLSNFNLIVGTTGISGGDYKFLRKPMLTPEELEFAAGKIAVLFGREDFGLLKEELEMCHVLVKVPTSDAYPVMNVSHAAAVILYFLSKLEKKEEKLATAADIEIVVRKAEELLREIDFPERRIKRVSVTLRRVLGRAKLRDYEFETLAGIFGKTLSYIKRKIKASENKN